MKTLITLFTFFTKINGRDFTPNDVTKFYLRGE